MALDIICLLFALLGFYLGFSRGIIGTVFNALSLALGVVAAMKFAPIMQNLIEQTFNTKNPLMYFAGMLLAFVLTMVLIRTLARGLEGVLKTANINIINQVLGGALLAAVMIMIYSFLLDFGEKARLVDDQTKLESKTYPYIAPFRAKAKAIGKNLVPIMSDFWNKSLDVMDRLEDMSIERTEDQKVYDIPDDEAPNKKEDSVN